MSEVNKFFYDISFDDYKQKNPCAEVVSYDIVAQPAFVGASLYADYLEHTEILARELMLYTRKNR